MTKAQFLTYVDNTLPSNVVGGIEAADLRTIIKNLASQLYDDFATLADLGAQGPRQLWLRPADAQPALTNSESVYHNGSVGIGVTTPSEKLHVGGNAVISGIVTLPGATAVLTVGVATALAVLHIARSGGVNFMISETSQGTDGKHWERRVTGATLLESIANDANNNLTTYQIVTRSGMTISSVVWRLAGVDLVRILSNGMGIGTSGSPTSMLHVKGTTGHQQFRMETSYTPTGTADANGAVGSMVWDDSYVYVKTTAGWKRSALSTF